MPDIKYKLEYPDVDWKKIHQAQDESWRARAIKEPKKKKKPNLCQTRKHDWEGEYKDGWLLVHCLICKVKNVSYFLSKRELECIENGWWTVNDLYIRVDKKGNVLDANGRKKMNKAVLDSLPKIDPFDLTKLSIAYEEYKEPVKSNGKAVKNSKKFYLPPMPWKWTIYRGFDVVTFGYAHTREDAEEAANKAINQ